MGWKIVAEDLAPGLRAHLAAIARAIEEAPASAVPAIITVLSGMLSAAASRILDVPSRAVRPDAFPDETLSADEGARLLRIQRRTLMTWARRGEVPHLVLKWGKDGRAAVVRFSTERLRAWIAQREKT